MIPLYRGKSALFKFESVFAKKTFFLSCKLTQLTDCKLNKNAVYTGFFLNGFKIALVTNWGCFWVVFW